MTTDTPDYDIDIDAADLLADLATDAAAHGRDYEEKRGWWDDSLGTHSEFYNARIWMLEARGAQRAYAKAIASLQPEQHSLGVDTYRTADGDGRRGRADAVAPEGSRGRPRSGWGGRRKPASRRGRDGLRTDPLDAPGRLRRRVAAARRPRRQPAGV